MTNNQIREAIAAGGKAASIARLLGIPITRVHHIAYLRGTIGRPEVPCKCASCKRKMHTHGGPSNLCSKCVASLKAKRTTAHLALRKAIARGEVKPAREYVCVDCGKPATDYDHRDYSKPLDVQPVCRGCNIRRGPAK